MDPADRRTFLRRGAATTAALAAAGAAAAARPGRAHADPGDPGAVPAREMRGVWIASVANIDWPSAPGLGVRAQQDEYRAALDLAAERGLNAVFSQVRPTADAFWPSPHEPWSRYLTGTQGRDPGYDPLAFQIQEAHARDLEFHAWFNPYRVAMSEDPATLVADHPARRNPDWVWPYGGKLYYDPGLPEVRAFALEAMLDAVERYDVDGAHFDDYFYPYPVAGQEVPDAATYAVHAAPGQSLADWRRENIDLLVQEFGHRVHAIKPWVRFTISPFGIWRNRASDPAGSDTSGTESYTAISADSRRWVRERWVDGLIPQVYWQVGHPAADYDTLARWWDEVAAGTDVSLWIGEAAYKAAAGTFPDPEELSRHVALCRTLPRVGGAVHFSLTSLRTDTTGSVDRMVDERYAHPAIVPVSPLVPGVAPPRPQLHAATGTPTGVRLRFSGQAATSFALWRFPEGRGLNSQRGDGRYLLGTVRATGGPQVHEVLGGRPTDWYAVTALDRTRRQSILSVQRRATPAS